LRTQISANPNAVHLDGGELIPATRGQIKFQVGSGLQQWAFTNTSAFQVRVNASSLNVAELAKAAGVTTPVSGTLSADVQASGTQLSPMGHGKIDLTGARIGDEPIRTANITFDGNGTSVNAKLRADSPAGSTTADVRYEPKQQAYEASLRAVGIKLERLETVKAKNMQLTGALNITANGRGTLQDPGLKAVIEIPRLQIRDQVMNGIKLDTDVANHVAKLNLASDVLGTHAAGHGTIQLAGDYPADIAVDTSPIALQPLVALYSPSQASSLNGQTELHATLRGPLKKKTLIEAHLVVPNLNVNYKNTIQLAAAAPIRADYVNGALEIKRSVIRGTGTELTFQAHVPAAKDAPASLLLQGTIDLRLAEMLNSDMTATGQLRFDINSYGARSDPNVQGQIRIVNAGFTEAGVPLGMRNGNGVLTLTRDRLDITQFQGIVGGGTVTARGGIVYRPNLYFDLAMKADEVRALYEQSVRTTLSSNLALTGQYDSAMLQGQVNVEELSFTSNFDLMDFAGQFGGGAATPPPTGGFSEKLRLQVAIQTPGGLSLSSRKLSMSGSANLQVRGTAAQPVILGRINLSDGELIFSGNRYVVQSGTIDFRNPSRTEPVVDIAANTTIQQYEIQMHFWGPADQLHTNYSSDPALPPADVINLIAFGKTSEAAAANPTPPGTLGAQSLLASQVSSQVSSRIEKLAGLSQLSIDPVLGSGQQSPGARIAVQQRVTSKIFVTFASDVTSTQQQAIKLEYQMNRKASLTIVRNQNGGLSFETSFRKSW
jgi:translocation and assembly module TamB